MVYCPHEKRGKRSLYIYMQLILLYESLKFIAELLRHLVYVTEKATKRRGQFVIPVLGHNILHTTTNLTLYRVLSYGESSGTILRFTHLWLSRLGAI